MTARTKYIESLTIAEKYGGLIFPNDKLGSEFDLPGPLFWVSMDDLGSSVVKPFNNFHELCHVSTLSRH